MRKKAIVVFDSGVGGLTVLKELKKRNVAERFVYLADSKNAPYGDKTKEEIIIHVINSFNELNRLFDFKAIVIACNTASVYTKDILEILFKVPVYSVIEAATKFLNSIEERVSTDVLATKLTVSSHAYQKRVPNLHIKEIACSSFVPFIESEAYDSRFKRKEVVYEGLLGLSTENSKIVVLGCTHYPLLLDEIKEFYGAQCTIVNPSELLADELALQFTFKSLAFNSTFFITEENSYFDNFASILLNQTVSSIILNEDFFTKNTLLYNHQAIF